MNAEQEVRTLLTVKEAAERLRISPYTLRRWIKLNRIQGVRLKRGHIRFDPQILEQWIRLHRT